MRKIYFNPMPALSAILIIGVAILIALGVWQYQRLQWKTALLSEVEASVTALPLSSLAELEQALTDGGPVDFRRIGFAAFKVEAGPAFHLYRSQTGGIAWDVVEPLQEAGLTILAKTKTLSNVDKDKTRVIESTSQQTFTGYVRKVYPMGTVENWVKSKANTKTNRYFHFNQTSDWYDAVRRPNIQGYYIDLEEAASASDLPILRPDIRNNHLDYMLTWWSFALIFIIIYLILHKRAGRLKFS